MTLTPLNRTPLPTDAPLMGWLDIGRSQRVVMARTAVRVLLPTNGARPILAEDPENPGTFTQQWQTYHGVIGCGTGGADDAVIVLFETIDEAERDQWLVDNAEAWLG